MISKEELMNRILLLEPDFTQALLELISDYETKMIKLEKQDKILEILKQKPQSELHLVLLGKFKTYNEYLKYTDTDRWGWEYTDKVFSKKEFDLIKEWIKDDK